MENSINMNEKIEFNTNFLDINDEEVNVKKYDKVSIVKSYLRQISNYELLTLEEEIKYSKDLLLRNKISILIDKKINGKIFSVIDLEKILVSIDNLDTLKNVLDILNSYYFNSYRSEAINNKAISGYLSNYSSLVNKSGIPDSNLLNQYFSEFNTFNIFTKFDDNKKMSSDELIKQVNMCVDYFRAKDIMYNHNLRLVVSVAKNYSKNGNFMDLIISGNLGLMEAVERFDSDKGCKFSTFAVYYIKKYIWDELRNDSSIRIPINKKNEIFSFLRKVDKLTYDYGRNLTIFEIAKELNLSVKEVDEYLFYVRNVINTASLDTPVKLDDEETLVDFVPSSYYGVEKKILDDELKETLNQILSNFREKEIQIMNSRYGLNGCNRKTLNELAKEYGVSYQRINNIENNVLKKMRRLAKRYHLDDYL